jgi:trehalose utilization protein
VLVNGVRWARPQGWAADTPRHVPVEQAREKIEARGGTLHDADGRLAS